MREQMSEEAALESDLLVLIKKRYKNFEEKTSFLDERYGFFSDTFHLAEDWMLRTPSKESLDFLNHLFSSRMSYAINADSSCKRRIPNLLPEHGSSRLDVSFVIELSASGLSFDFRDVVEGCDDAFYYSPSERSRKTFLLEGLIAMDDLDLPNEYMAYRVGNQTISIIKKMSRESGRCTFALNFFDSAVYDQVCEAIKQSAIKEALLGIFANNDSNISDIDRAMDSIKALPMFGPQVLSKQIEAIIEDRPTLIENRKRAI